MKPELQRIFTSYFYRLKPLKTAVGLFVFYAISSLDIMACPIELPTANIVINGISLTVELATTPTTRGCGLSYREALPENRGMLFIFPDLRPRNFWMKDTAIPLSIAYLDESGRIFSIQDMVPMQIETQYPSGQPAKYALEVNLDWFQLHGIDVGDVVEMKLPMVLNIR